MNNPNNFNPTAQICSHGIERNIPCFFCARTGTYFDRDLDKYQEIYSKSAATSFELAFELVDRIEVWTKATKNMVLEEYFNEIAKSPKIRWSKTSLKQAYYVAREFPELRGNATPKLTFSAYREIATSKLSPEQKRAVRITAEEDNMKFKQVRQFIKKEFRTENAEGKQYNEIVEKFIYLNSVEFKEQVDYFLIKHRDIDRNTEIIIKYRKNFKERSEKMAI